LGIFRVKETSRLSPVPSSVLILASYRAEPEWCVSDGKKERTYTQKEKDDMARFSDIRLEDRLSFYVTCGIFVMAAVTAFILIRQANLMEGQLEEMKGGGSQTDRLIILNTGQMANAAKTASAARDQAIAAQSSVEAMQNQMHLDQRAWVSVDVGEKAGNFSVSMHNTGKTPALKVIYLANFTPGKRGIFPDVDLRQNPISQILSPNAPKELVDRLKRTGYIKETSETGFIIAPNASQIGSDYQGKFLQIFRFEGERIYVQGRITYQDVFGKTHQTIYCYWAELPQNPLPPGIIPPTDFVMCHDHNLMD
jgi:hypothetical protein